MILELHPTTSFTLNFLLNMLSPKDAKNRVIGKDPDAGKD